ncbi:aspartic proteinase 36-like [Pyrus x bretschneideri]|uniref:aspartic proteinase 36-like n=1 Tax=Pyrus x bretschneideri TaxID=225117 RepID=UPI002030F988|nr:aspartic proteinase 36-like [Pyrus x bretschneideri]
MRATISAVGTTSASSAIAKAQNSSLPGESSNSACLCTIEFKLPQLSAARSYGLGLKFEHGKLHKGGSIFGTIFAASRKTRVEPTSRKREAYPHQTLPSNASANFVFPVSHKFNGRDGRSLSELKAHDSLRCGRILAGSASAVDVQLGGNGRPSETRLYFAKLGIGSPSKDYFVQVDTGSDILWVNCIDCTNCPTKSDIGVKLTLYDPKGFSSSNAVTCNQEFCTSKYNGQLPGCRPDLLCQYDVTCGDGSATAGYFVKDTIQFDKGTNGSVVFGCGAKQSGQLGKSSEALDGILGFGQANSSVFSQLATFRSKRAISLP